MISRPSWRVFGRVRLRPRAPPCAADLVLIDSSRYSHPGIIATLLLHNATRPDTVFLVEDDSWLSSSGSERLLLQRHWRLAALSSSHPRGEMWPWITFRIDGEAPPSPPQPAAH